MSKHSCLNNRNFGKMSRQEKDIRRAFCRKKNRKINLIPKNGSTPQSVLWENFIETGTFLYSIRIHPLVFQEKQKLVENCFFQDSMPSLVNKNVEKLQYSTISCVGLYLCLPVQSLRNACQQSRLQALGLTKDMKNITFWKSFQFFQPKFFQKEQPSSVDTREYLFLFRFPVHKRLKPTNPFESTFKDRWSKTHDLFNFSRAIFCYSSAQKSDNFFSVVGQTDISQVSWPWNFCFIALQFCDVFILFLLITSTRMYFGRHKFCKSSNSFLLSRFLKNQDARNIRFGDIAFQNHKTESTS